MVTIIGVNFRNSGKVYYFDPCGERIERGQSVIVETSQGIEYGDVVLPTQEVDESRIVGELKPITRVATEDDRDQIALNRRNEVTAIKICRQKIADHGLEMKLIRAEYAFDRTKLTFYFTADGRVDFRELVRDLASVFHTRIELRQVGVRDETKILGGIGICGRPLCCATWLTDFVPVSIKMAKEQNISLNSAKISGVCGRLMCCLKNEAETYEYLNSKLPKIGSFVRTPDGQRGQVKSVNILRQRVSVLIGDDEDEKEIQEFPVEELDGAFRRNLENGEAGQPEEGALREEENDAAPAENEISEEQAERPARRERNSRREMAEKNPEAQKERSERRENPQRERTDRRENPQRERSDRRENPQRERTDRRENPQRERAVRDPETQKERPDRNNRNERPNPNAKSGQAGEDAEDGGNKKNDGNRRRYYKYRPRRDNKPKTEA